MICPMEPGCTALHSNQTAQMCGCCQQAPCFTLLHTGLSRPSLHIEALVLSLEWLPFIPLSVPDSSCSMPALSGHRQSVRCMTTCLYLPTDSAWR